MADRELKTGFSTGTAAAAATKAALLGLLGNPVASVSLTLPGGEELTVGVHQAEPKAGGAYRATVIKDAGDDPDVTHKAEIISEARLLCRR